MSLSAFGLLAIGLRHLGVDLFAGLSLSPLGQDEILISGGTFQMGSTRGEKDEAPIHCEAVADFKLDRLETTFAEYQACVEEGACTKAGTFHAACGAHDVKKNAKRPVNCVTYEQARNYCEYRGKRLPREEEWEYVARAGDDRQFPWGDAPPDKNTCFQRTETCEPGTSPQDLSPSGLMDLGGGVSEWTSSRYCAYDDRKRCKAEARVIRGGSWHMVETSYMRTTYRDWVFEPHAGYNLGIRCASSVPNAKKPKCEK